MLPTPLYEALPAIYGAMGVVALGATTNALGAVSAALLLAAAGVIARMRWTHRSRKENR